MSASPRRQRGLVAVAWPYAAGRRHIGHVAAYVPSDAFARYHRLRGNDVLMVSGTDEHGTPVMVVADQEGVSPRETADKYNALARDDFRKLGLSYDLFTRTTTPNHYRVVRDVFRTLYDHGFIFEKTTLGAFSASTGNTLPDRYIEGTCPNCGFPRARGDQCDNCGPLHEPWDLIEPRSTLDGAPITFRETEHYFLDLAKLEPPLREWLDSVDRSYWRQNTLLFTQNWLKQGLRGRAITRDLDWGVPVPVADPAFKDKRIYVWFDAVIGYLSASIEWASRKGEPDAWKRWW